MRSLPPAAALRPPSTTNPCALQRRAPTRCWSIFKSLQLTLAFPTRPMHAYKHSSIRRPTLRLAKPHRADERRCGDWREKLKIASDGGSVDLAGSFTHCCGEKVLLHLAPGPPTNKVERLFRSLWRELSGSLAGFAFCSGNTRNGGCLRPNPRSGEIVRDMNKLEQQPDGAPALSPLLAPAYRPQRRRQHRQRIGQWLQERGLMASRSTTAQTSRATPLVTAEGLDELLLSSESIPEMMASADCRHRQHPEKRLRDSPPPAAPPENRLSGRPPSPATSPIATDSAGEIGVINDPQMKNGSAPLDTERAGSPGNDRAPLARPGPTLPAR